MTLRINERRRRRYASCAGLLFLFSGLFPAFVGPPYGIESATPVAAYINGTFPAESPVLPANPTAWKAGDAFPNLQFSNILAIEAVPNSNYLSVADRAGKIWVFENRQETSTKHLIADLTDRVVIPRDGGFMGLAFHPEFGLPDSPNAGYVFASYNAENDMMRLSRFATQTDGLTLDPASELIMIESSHAGGSTHFGGSLAFGNDGFLYVPFGDAEVRISDAQTITDNLVGGILRIDVDMNSARSHPPRRRLPKTDPDEMSGRGYWIPNDNPFLNTDGSIFEEYFSIGHRNPWKLAQDRETGEIWVSEVGDLKRDEFNVLVAGGNYGWYMREGSVDADLAAETPIPPAEPLGSLQDPVFDDRFGVISGGVIYRGNKHPSLLGAFVGYANGIIALTLDNAGKKAVSRTLVASNAVGFIWAFGTDHKGEILFIEGGQNKRIKTIAPIYHQQPNVPSLLSETGVFADLNSREPAPGFFPYSLNAPSWNNGARVSRWIAIPNDGQHDTPEERIEFRKNDSWQYPPGAVAIQHFDLPVDELHPEDARPVETRILVLGESNAFYGLTYRWRPDGSDAELLTEERIETIQIHTAAGTSYQSWRFPALSECASCHTSTNGPILGPQTRQLNGLFWYPQTGVTANQLESWNHIDLFEQKLNIDALNDFPAASGLEDATASLEHRARSYLDANCGYCHHPDGAISSSFDARFATPLEQTGLINGAVTKNFGISNAVIIAPGDTSRSLLYARLRSLETPLAMPPLGKTHVDSAGLQLMAEWILSLGGRLQSFYPERALPGEQVVLQGTRFTEVSAVFFNGTPGEFAILSSTQITAIVPDSASTGPISISTAAGVTYSQSDFEVLDAFQTGAQSTPVAPSKSTLIRAYPNPVAYTMTIDFQLPQTERIKLALFDAHGRLVRLVLSGVRVAGRHQTILDAGQLASGTYFLRLQTGAQVFTQTIIRI